jgi:WD40 repeat protein
MDEKPEQRSSKPLVNSNVQPEYAPSVAPGIGYLLFVREGTLMAQPFDNRRLELTGQVTPVAERVGDYRAFSTSANDVLVFQRSEAADRQLKWYDRAGRVLGAAGDPGDYQSVALSPDGTRLAVSKRSGQGANIWLVDLSLSGAGTRFTFGSASDTFPVWSPDGSHIIFSSNRDGSYNLYQKPANGAKDEEVLLKSGEDKFPTSWSRDGRFLLYTVVHPKTKSDIWVLPLDNEKKPVPFLITEFNEEQAHFSADGHWVAYASDESGRLAVYVRSFSMASAGTVAEAGGKRQISNAYGQEPRWRADGRELYYLSLPDYESVPDGRAMSVEISTDPAFRAEKPEPLGILPLVNAWDSSFDAKRFVVSVTKSGPQPYTVVLDWQAALKK